MTPLAQEIAQEIARSGPIPFRRFMERALYDPAHGYYASGRAAIGRGGDFFTNVSVGPFFGRLLAEQFAEMWERLERPERFTLVEQGANRGDFAADVLDAAARFHPAFGAALRCVIVEPFAANRRRQAERLAGFPGRVSWHESLEALPPFTGVHFSNELPDAFPVHRVVRREGQWREQYVTLGSADAFAWTDGPLSDPRLESRLPRLPEIEGYRSEINLEAPAWLRTVAARLERGYALVADYGFSRDDYYLPERTDGTLAAYRRHELRGDPLAGPGEQDLTAHVDFTALALAGREAGLALAGFADQHHFLAALGRLVLPDVTDPGRLTPERRKQQREFATLMHPGLMGRGFHFLAMSRNAPGGLSGYGLAPDGARRLGFQP